MPIRDWLTTLIRYHAASSCMQLLSATHAYNVYSVYTASAYVVLVRTHVRRTHSYSTVRVHNSFAIRFTKVSIGTEYSVFKSGRNGRIRATEVTRMEPKSVRNDI